MITKEFQDVIAEKNLLRAKIMLKDSLIVDTSFKQFDEMFAYSKRLCPQILDDFNGESLELDQTKWNKELMNLELIILINNFSVERIEHLKKVITKVLGSTPSSTLEKSSISSTPYTAQGTVSTNGSTFQNSISPFYKQGLNAQSELRLHNRQSAYRKLVDQGRRIEKILQQTQIRGNKWSSTNVEAMERAAYEILDAVTLYKNNREK